MSQREYLFNSHSFWEILELHKRQLKVDINNIPSDEILKWDSQKLEEELFVKNQYKPLELGEISVSQDDVKVDVSQDHNRFILDRSQPFYLDGTRVTYYVPFTGDECLFLYSPNSFTSRIPIAHKQGHELLFIYECVGNISETKTFFNEELLNMSTWINGINGQVDQFNKELPALINNEILARRRRIMEAKSDIRNLGFKVREKEINKPVINKEEVVPNNKNTDFQSDNPSLEYDVAFSFAGEDRVYVEDVANELSKAKVRVFYDKYETVDLWGKNLVDHLAEIYLKRSRYVVMFISKYYAQKVWPNHERKNALAHALKSKEEYILPARFDNTEIPGLLDTISYIDLSATSPKELAEMIKTKIA